MFDALKYVTTPLTLVAFLSIILFYYLRDRNKKQVDLLKEGDPGRKNEALQILLDRYQIDSSNLTPQQKYNLIMEQVRRRDSKFKWAIFASIVLGIVGAVIFFMVNATNKLSSLSDKIVPQEEVKPAVDNTRNEAVTPVKNNTVSQDESTGQNNNTLQDQPAENSANGLTLHENSSQGFSVKFNAANWLVEDNAAAGYGQPSTGFSHKQYPNDIAVSFTINAINNLDFESFSQNILAMLTQMNMKVTEVNRSAQYVSVSGYNPLYAKMNIARIYYSPGRSLAVDVIYTQTMESSAALKEAVAMMKSAKFD